MEALNKEDSIKEKIDSKEKKGILNTLNVWNDVYARVFLDGNVDVVTDMINAALEKEDIRIVEMKTQVQKGDLKAKEVIFDAVGTDDKGRKYAIEIQNQHKKGFEERLAYNAAFLIQMTLEKGDEHEDRQESTLIAFCKFKPRGVSTDQVIYNVGRVYLETGERYPDNEKIVIVNGTHIPDLDTLMGKVLHDMYEEESKNMLLNSFKKTTHELKETEEGVKKMGEVQQMIEARGEARGFIRGKEQGRTEGLIQGAIKMRDMMIEMNIPIEKIHKRLEQDYSPEIAQEVLSQLNLVA